MGGGVRIADIQRAMARELGVPLSIMRESARGGTRNGTNAWPIARARQSAMALSILLTEHSYPRVGYFFGGRDPTTVRHACAIVAERRRSDERLHNAMRRVTLELVRR